MDAPNHIGIIMDGNRRYAKSNLISSLSGHKSGAKKVHDVIKWCKEYKLKELTLYAFSMENFSRSETEVSYLMNLFNYEFKSLISDEINTQKLSRNGIKINLIGRLKLFSKELINTVMTLKELTKNNNSLTVNFALAYGGRAELVDAVKQIAKQAVDKKINPDEIDETTINLNVYNPSEPDIIIRTGGEKRLSGFLLWQSAYSELIFVNKYWPEFEKEDFLECLKEFSNRKRNFGK